MVEAEEYLREARELHRKGEYKKGLKAARKARKRFLKAGDYLNAAEALRIMADCALNGGDINEAKRLYKELLEEGTGASLPHLESAGNWGLGEAAIHHMDFQTAEAHFRLGLQQARDSSNMWFIAWNSFGLAKALRGMGRVKEALALLDEAERLFVRLGMAEYAAWTKKMRDEMSAEKDATVPEQELRVWLCPMCGCRFAPDVAKRLSSGEVVTCQYCGTSVGA